jgi:serine/threonine protein kinase
MSGRIIGPYAIQGLLGSGGIGHVYSALDQDLGRLVALKALRPEFSDDPDLLERFRSEAANLARLNHPNITTLYSLYRETTPQRQNVFMVMEMVNGETLEAILARSGRLSSSACLAIMAQAIAGLSYAHSVGIIHRDIKPSNLMLNDAGLLKITDFGIARVQGSQRLTRHGAVVGTLNYISPEQIKGRESDERSDLYSLACVLYKLLSGRTPFVGLSEYELIRAQLEVEAEPLTASMPELEPHIGHAVKRALAKNPDDRYSSLGEFAEALGTASVQEAAVAIVREQMLTAVRPSEPSVRHEHLLLDEFEAAPDSAAASFVSPALTDEQRPPVQAPTREKKRGRTMAAATSAVMIILAGGSYVAYTSDRAPVAVGVQEPSEPPPDRLVIPQAKPSARSDQSTVGQAAPSPTPGKPPVGRGGPPQPATTSAAAQGGPAQPPNAPAVAQAAPSEPSSKLAMTQGGAAEPPTNQGGPSQPAGEAAATQSAPSEPPSQPAVIQEGSRTAGTEAQPSGASQPASLPPVAPSTDASLQPSAPPPQPAPGNQPPTVETTSNTVGGEVSSYSEDGWPVIEGTTVRLNGVGPLGPGEAKPVSDWIAGHGNYLKCTAAQPGGYRCLTRQNFDLAQTILLNGAARTSPDAAPAYRDAESQARVAKRGVWR